MKIIRKSAVALLAAGTMAFASCGGKSAAGGETMAGKTDSVRAENIGEYAAQSMFPVGEPNAGFAQYLSYRFAILTEFCFAKLVAYTYSILRVCVANSVSTRQRATHGAAKDSWFSHLSVSVRSGEGSGTDWLEPVDRGGYDALE